MYMIIRKYAIVPGSAPELKRRIQTDLLPLISYLPGLIAFYLLDVSAEEVASVTIFDSKGHADMASGPTAFWMRKALGDDVLGFPTSSQADGGV